MLLLAVSGNLFGQSGTVQTISGLSASHMPVASSVAPNDVENGSVTEDASGDISTPGMVTATGAVSGSALLAQVVSAPTSNGQGLVTVLVENSANNSMATSVGPAAS